MTKYSELLKNPKWQKRRLEILERDGWECQICGDKDSTLHVHHIRYVSAYFNCPWEVPSKHLITLCAYCHEEEPTLKSNAEDAILKLLRRHLFLSVELGHLYEGLEEALSKSGKMGLLSLLPLPSIKEREE